MSSPPALGSMSSPPALPSPAQVDMGTELDAAAEAVKEELRAKYLKAEDLQQYAIRGGTGAGQGKAWGVGELKGAWWHQGLRGRGGVRV